MKVERNEHPMKPREYDVKRNPKDYVPYRDLPKKNFGGHIPYVEDDCERFDKVFEYEGTRWIDNGICISCSRYKTCENRNQYMAHIKSVNQINLKKNAEGKNGSNQE